MSKICSDSYYDSESNYDGTDYESMHSIFCIKIILCFLLYFIYIYVAENDDFQNSMDQNSVVDGT